MSLGSENGLSAADIAAVTDRNNGSYGGWGGGFGEMLVAMIMLFLFPMMFGGFGGGMWGGMGNGGLLAAANGALTRADLCSEFNFNGLENAVRGVQNGLCDGFYAMQGSINGLGANMMQYSYQAEIANSQRQAALMQQLCNLGYQQKDCCCETQRSIDRVNYDAAMRGNETNRLMERGFCETNYNAATNTTAIIQNAHNDTDRVLARLDAMESSRKDEKIAEQAAEIQAYRQNAAFGAMIDASRAEILRRTGAECPTAAYIVQPPTPVTFPTNCCGQVNFGGWGNNCGGCAA